jgi:glycosyltransferase involved in cell wall biosynthesis
MFHQFQDLFVRLIARRQNGGDASLCKKGPGFPKDGKHLIVGRPTKKSQTLHGRRHLNPLKNEGLTAGNAERFVSQYDMKQVEFMERLDEHELSDLIRNARFLVVPSEGYYETFGMVIIEAYSRGVPVVAADIGVVPELVSDQETGLLFEAGNAPDLTRKARWMWDHRSRCLIKNGQSHRALHAGAVLYNLACRVKGWERNDLPRLGELCGVSAEEFCIGSLM